MSSEVCPFCGRSFKRLRSHLPHCKAAKAQTEVTERDVRATPPPVSGVSEATAKGKKSTESLSGPRAKKSPSDSSAPSLSSSPPPSTKKKTKKPTEQIQLTSTPSLVPPPSSSTSKPKKKSLRASDGSLEGSRPASDSLSGSRTTAPTETGFMKDGITLSTDTKPKDAPKKKAPKTKRAAQPPSGTKDPDSDLFDSGLNIRTHVRDELWVNNVEETKDSNVTIVPSRSSEPAWVTIQGAKTLLGRTRTSSSSRKTILSETPEDLSSKSRVDPGPSAEKSPAEAGKDGGRCSVTQTVPEQPLSAATQRAAVLTAKDRGSTSKEAFVIPLEHDGSSQPKLFLPETPPGSVSALQGQKVGRHMTDLHSLSPSSIQFSSPRLLPLATQALPSRAGTPRAADGQVLEDGKLNAVYDRSRGHLTGAGTRQSLGQVKLRELPQWLVCHAPSRPRDAVDLVQRGWQWYYRKYFDVRKGGVGGVSMLLAGYCVLSYVWSYPHIKLDRWRKYH